MSSLERFEDHAIADLYDEDIKKVGELWNDVLQRFAHRSNSQANLAEMAKYAEHKFLEKGFVVAVDVSPALLDEPPIITVRGKIEGFEEFDHERKGWEVNKANDKGEKFLGQKEKYGG